MDRIPESESKSESESEPKSEAASKTHTAYLWIHVLSTPIWAIYNLFPFILYKDLHATPLQITAIVTLKPLVSLISPYWATAINDRPDRLLSNVVWARILSLLPFFLFPFIDNVWFFIITFALYMLLARGVVPAWMEILKLNLPASMLGKTFAKGTMIGYCGNIIAPFILGWLLDGYHQAWRWLFPLGALISLMAVFLSLKIPIPKANELPKTASPRLPPISVKDQVLAPWKRSWHILRNNSAFCKFQWGFMLGGAGTMIAWPALPQFFVDILHLSYTEMTLALSCLKGIGFLISTPIWTQQLTRLNIFRFASWPPFWVCLYSVFLLSAQMHIVWLFLAYFCYGVMEGGSSLAWNLSGPLFSKNADSTAYSNTNVLAVGIRACIIPTLGTLIGVLFGSPAVIVAGGIICMLGHLTFLRYSGEMEQEKIVQE